MNTQPHPMIRKYLTALEARLRRTPGVVAEEGLADALEFLQSECESLARRGALISDDELFRHFVRKFGTPDDVATSYALATSASPVLANDKTSLNGPEAVGASIRSGKTRVNWSSLWRSLYRW